MYNQESENEQRSLCLIDGVPWRGKTGAVLVKLFLSLLYLNMFLMNSNTLYLGRLYQITQVADEIGVGVHFNPFVSVNDEVLAIQ